MRTPRSAKLLLTSLLLAVVLIFSACASDAAPDDDAAVAAASADLQRSIDESPASTPPSSAVAETEPSDAASTDSAGIDAVLDELEASDFHGVVLVDDRGDQTVRGFGLADRDKNLPVDGDTVFDVGSLTKQFTGAAILRLEMDGLVSVDDEVGMYLPELSPQQQTLTLHHLLTHTAGLPDALGDDYDPVDRDAFVELVAASRIGEAGSEHAYSNVGYSLLAAVIERVTGESYESYLQAALFAPAGMTATGYQQPDWGQHTVAVGYYNGDEATGRPDEQPWAEDGPYWHLRGNGGIMSTANDMFRWHSALLGDQILDAAAKEKLYGRHTDEGPGSGTYYGYGWAIFPTPFDTWLVTHNGGNGIFFADFLRFLDEDVTIFVATNAASTQVEDLAFELAAEILEDPELGPAADCTLEAEPLDSIEPITEFPDTVPGRTAHLWFELLDASDSQSRFGFIVDHLDPALTGGASPADVEAALVAIQQELLGAKQVGLLQDGDRRFHAEMLTPSDEAVTVSVELSPADPARVHCISISY